jgi:hypothetical protein
MTLGRTRTLRVVLLLASWAGAAQAQAAQSTTIIPLQSLSFGVLLPGARETVPITDIGRRAVVALAGSGPVDITLVLPSSLEVATGGSIPLVFGAGDAGLLPTIGGAVIPMNPFQVHRVQLAPDNVVHLVLGGTAFPSLSHKPGEYRARIVVIVSQPGT